MIGGLKWIYTCIHSLVLQLISKSTNIPFIIKSISFWRSLLAEHIHAFPMDPRWQPHRQLQPKPNGATFIRQTKSRPVAIVNPKSGLIQPKPAQNTKHYDLQSDFPPLGSSKAAAASLPRRSDSKIEISARKSDAAPRASDDELEPGFNVYARPFVPESLTVINTLDGQVIDTPAGRRINFDTYVAAYFGFDFLPPIPQPDDPESHITLATNDDHHTKYERRLRRYLEDEIQSQRKENESYNLYGHDVTLMSHNPGEPATCSFHVPGLRENSPYVEENDVVQLRQIRYDHQKRPYGMDIWMAPTPTPAYNGYGQQRLYPSVGGRWKGEQAPGVSILLFFFMPRVHCCNGARNLEICFQAKAPKTCPGNFDFGSFIIILSANVFKVD